VQFCTSTLIVKDRKSSINPSKEREGHTQSKTQTIAARLPCKQAISRTKTRFCQVISFSEFSERRKSDFEVSESAANFGAFESDFGRSERSKRFETSFEFSERSKRFETSFEFSGFIEKCST
jgi:hypothetical protein